MTQYRDDTPEDHTSIETKHESFGTISVNRINGKSNLFGVDYDNGGFIELEIQNATLHNSSGTEWVAPSGIVASVRMSEVQFARMITSPNSGRTPCTLVYVRDGQVKRNESPPTQKDLYTNHVDQMHRIPRGIASNLDHVITQMEQHLESKTPTKTELRELLSDLKQAAQGIKSDLNYHVGAADAAINVKTEQSKIEFDAYVQSSLAELGREVVRDRLANGMVSLRLGSQRVGDNPSLMGTDDE